MSVKATARSQYQAIVNGAANRIGGRLNRPPEGWIATMRKALGMSGPQLASRLGVTRARISQAEQAEIAGGVTLKTMHAMAEAMGGRFVYAIVPEGRVEDIIAAQARRKAEALVRRAGAHMALEDQSLSKAANEQEVERLTQEILRRMPADLWAEK